MPPLHGAKSVVICVLVGVFGELTPICSLLTVLSYGMLASNVYLKADRHSPSLRLLSKFLYFLNKLIKFEMASVVYSDK